MTVIKLSEASTPPSTIGLSATEIEVRRLKHGRNAVASGHDETFLDEVLESFHEPLVLLLLAVGGLYFVFGDTRDALIVLGVVVAVALTETMIEWRAGKAIAALTAMSDPKALVWRDGTPIEIAVEDLVPGDVLELRAGSRIGADARLLKSHDLAIDESLVTGEATPVVHDDSNPDLLGGTLVARGSGSAEVSQTGAASTLGQIAEMVAQAKEPKTPMQRRMGELARVLLWVAIGVSAIIPLIGVAAGQPPKEMLLAGLSLAFATIPEELAVLIVIVLGLGSLKLAKRGAIVRQLRAAETLGAVTTICTDKTGTLTQNKMTVTETLTAAEMLGDVPGDASLVLNAAVLASGDPMSEPMDAAIHAAGDFEWESEFYPFDQTLRMASGVWTHEDLFEIGTKGATEAVLSICTTFRRGSERVSLSETEIQKLAAAASDAGRAGRVLGVASRCSKQRIAGRESFEREMTFEGVVVLGDPIRPEVAAALAELRTAGIGVSIVTGDQPTTACYIAETAGLTVEDTISGPDLATMGDDEIATHLARNAVVARALPGDKLRIVQALTGAGAVVMMTGDGVNDAPALRAASVGVAMGQGGTAAAREAAGVVLTDDSFSTIVEAVRQGRRLFDNFRKAIRFYLAVKLAIILISAIAVISGYPIPFSPVQIVLLELLMDLGAALAFVNQPADSDIMKRPPRDPGTSFFERGLILDIVLGAVTLSAIVLGAFFWSMSQFGDLGAARTLALLSWLIGHAVLGFAMAFDDGRVRIRALAENPMFLVWLFVSCASAMALMLVPTFGTAIGAPGTNVDAAMTMVALSSIIPLWMVLRQRNSRKMSQSRLSSRGGAVQ